MKVLLHIGTFKTGSTMLQFALGRDREYLFEKGYLYDCFFEKMFLHSNLAYGLLKEALIHYGLFEYYRDHPRFTNVAQDPEMIIDNIRKRCDGRDIIISSEALFADSYRTLIGLDASDDRIGYMDDINRFMRRRLYELLSPVTDSIDVLCYLRRQDYYIESQYKQVSRTPWFTGSHPTDFESFIEAKPVHLDYYPELKDWAEVFGKDSVRIKKYDRDLISKGIVNDFYSNILNIPLSDKTLGSDNERINRSTHPVALEYAKSIDIFDDRLYKYLDSLDYNAMGFPKNIGYFTLMERKKFMKQYEESNRCVSKEFLGYDGDLFDEPSDETPVMNGLSDNEFKTVTKELINSFIS